MPLLFSYGTLQEANVQLSTFGRRLNGERDELPGFEQSLVGIEEPQAVTTSGKTQHANVAFNGNEDSRVTGMVFEITDAELASADEYEAASSYERVAAMLASGRQVWVYVHTPRAPGALPRIYVDLRNADQQGRLRLTGGGTLSDLAAQGVELREGLHLLVYSADAQADGTNDDLVVEGIVERDRASGTWTARIDWDALRHDSGSSP
jgi:gamma-glutamylcyclotransferase (GGCT)/AIG2-like uncharacterized protein YtfP